MIQVIVSTAQRARSTITDNTDPARVRHRGNRHGRSESARRAVLEAVDDLLVEQGFAALTIEGLAARAGVAKQTIYRWWPNKVEILIEALATDAARDLKPADTGDPAQDLRLGLHRLAIFLTRTDEGAVFRALAGNAQHDKEFAVTFRTRVLEPIDAAHRGLISRAAEAGLLTIDGTGPGAVQAMADELVAPVYYRALITGRPIGRGQLEKWLAAFLRAHGGPGS